MRAIDIFLAVLNLIIPLVTFFIGYWTSNRQIKKEREMKAKKERLDRFYLPAMKKLFHPDMFDSIIIGGGIALEEHPFDSYFEIVRELLDIRHLASGEVNSSLIACFRFFGGHEDFLDRFYNLIEKIETEGKQLAKDLGYSYFSPSEYGEYWEHSACPDRIGCEKSRKKKSSHHKQK